VIYCRRCDLAFCARHVGAHDETLEGHELAEHPAATFCAVCAGIYRAELGRSAPAPAVTTVERPA
jgi:hypothetical protein